MPHIPASAALSRLRVLDLTAGFLASVGILTALTWIGGSRALRYNLAQSAVRR